MHEETISGKKLDFALNNFEIGSTLTAKMKEFKIYEVAMGAETFTHSTESKIESSLSRESILQRCAVLQYGYFVLCGLLCALH